MEKSFYNTLINFDFSQKASLCSLIHWKGSVPRKDYPLMLVLENGKIIGTIGGGNVENEIIEKAKTVNKKNYITFETFDLTSTNATSEGGLCGGVVKILIEPYTQEIQSFWKSLNYLDRKQNNTVMITEVQQKAPVTSHRHLIYPDDPLQRFPCKVKDAIKTVQSGRDAATMETTGKLFLIQRILTPPILHIFGAGHIGGAVAELAHFIELDAHIYDDRKDLANSDRFPHAKFISNKAFSKLSDHINISPEDYILIATRGHLHDLELLRWLVTREVSYIGLVSSQRKWKILSETLLDEGVSSDQLNTVHSPVGLDIKSETVPEIALSIISEIIHNIRANKRSTLSLSFKS